MLVFREILRTYLMDDSFPNITIVDYYLQVHFFSNIIEHGQTSCSFADEDMFIDEIERAAKETPDEITRVQEFENRLNFALEQSLLLQMKQMNQIDNLEHDLKVKAKWFRTRIAP